MKIVHHICTALLALLLPFVGLDAKQLSPSQAISRAFASDKGRLKSAAGNNLQLLRTVTDSLGRNAVFVCRNTSNGRLYFLSADDCARPLLGVTDGPCLPNDSLPGPMKEWMEFYKKQIAYGIDHNLKFEDLPMAVPQVRDGRLKKDEAPLLQSVPVLLPYEWGTIPFNALCPQVDGVPTKVGCVALAMYQIMSYYSYPARGRDTVQYMAAVEQDSVFVQHDLAPSVYDWEALTDLETEQGKAAAAVLGRDCAYAVRANFGLNNTSARIVNIKSALLRYFSYDSSMVCVGRSGDSKWFRVIYNELANRRPVAYSASGSYGHAFVCDGFNAEDSTFHFNWSWYGKYNGFYSLSALTPGTDVFNDDHMAIIGIQPPGLYRPGTDHVFCYGDLVVSPSIARRNGCQVVSKLNASSANEGVGSTGVFFAPPCYPQAQVALMLSEEGDTNAKPVTVMVEYGRLLEAVPATYERSLYMPFDVIGLSNGYSFLKCDTDYKLRLVYRDAPTEEWRPVAFPYGGSQGATIRMCANGVFFAPQNGMPPLLSTAWRHRYINGYCPKLPNGDKCSPGYDATAICQMVYAMRAPQKITGPVYYDDFETDSLNHRFSFDSPSADVYPVSLALRTHFGLTSHIEGVPAMMYGLRENMGLKRCEFMARKFYTTAQWLETVDRQLNLGSPIYYCGYHICGADSARRAFVVDGYNDSLQYHANFGDGGDGDKFLDLNIANRTGTTPGNTDVCFAFDQGMVADFFSECFVDSVSAPQDHIYMLMEPMVVNGDPAITQLKCGVNDTLTISYNLADYKAFENDDIYADYDFEIAMGYTDGTGDTGFICLNHVFMPALKGSVQISPAFMFGQELELFIATTRDGDKWEKVLNYAPNSLKLTIGEDSCLLTLPFNASVGAELGMAGAYQLVDDEKKGPLLHLPLENRTSSNFSDFLRIVATTAGGGQFVYEGQPVAVYGNTRVDWDIALPADVADALNGGARLSVYYKAGNGWKPLVESTMAEIIPSGSLGSDGGVAFYDANGRLLSAFAPGEVAGCYARFLASLPAGVYLVRENGVTRKFVKVRN